MGRARHWHWLRTRTPRPYDIWEANGHTKTGDTEIDDELTAYCGYQVRAKWDAQGSGTTFAATEGRVSCPICNQKLARERLKARPADAPTLELVQDKEAKGLFRHQGGWQVWVGGEHVGWTGYEDHYWRIYMIGNGREREVVTWGVGPLLGPAGYGKRAHYSGVCDAFGFACKELALLKAEELRAEGRLKTRPEIEAAEAAAEVRYRAREDRFRRERDAKHQRKSDILEGLIEIAAKAEAGDIVLSNFQREALAGAIVDYTPKAQADHPLEEEEAA